MTKPSFFVLAFLGVCSLESGLLPFCGGDQHSQSSADKPKPLEKVIEELQSKDASVRFFAALDIRGRGPEAKKAAPYLIKLLKDEKVAVRGMAIMALAELRTSGKEAIPLLIKFLEDGKANLPKKKKEFCEGPVDDSSNDSILHEIMKALGKIGPDAKGSIPLLIFFLANDPEIRNRKAAIDALGRFGEHSRNAVPELIKAIEKAPLRNDAIWALGQIGSDAKKAVPRIMICLKEEDHRTRYNAVVALGKMGPAAKESIESLNYLIRQESNQSIREAALAAIRRITKN